MNCPPQTLRIDLYAGEGLTEACNPYMIFTVEKGDAEAAMSGYQVRRAKELLGCE